MKIRESTRADEYNPEKSPEENAAVALFEIAAAIRGLLYAFKYEPVGGLSVSEAISVGAQEIAHAIDGSLEEITGAMLQRVGGRPNERR